MTRVRGIDKALGRLDRMSGPHAMAAAKQALFVAAEHLVADARQSITSGAVSGLGHVASLPGEPPKADTHQLDTSIVSEEVSATPKRVHYRAVANAPYAVALEFGTSKLAERPFMRPAAKRTRPTVLKLVAAAIRALNRRGA